MDDLLRVALVQTDIVWEDKARNRERCAQVLEQLAGRCDLAVLPEMFTTGFSMRAEELSEPVSGPTVEALVAWARRYRMALAGSFMAREGERCYNRGFIVTPDGEAHYYDKRHLFRMGEEGRHFAAGNRHLIVNYRGWNIALQVCYDLRFPVWCRNVNNGYDLLLVVANWPQSRGYAWRSLLIARAIENAAYVCGVNRTGKDSTSMVYRGDTMAVGVKGEILAEAEPFTEQVVEVELDLSKVRRFREKFPVWKDADNFSLE